VAPQKCAVTLVSAGTSTACLRRFYDWDAQRDSYPHPQPELMVWQYIRGQLRPR